MINDKLYLELMLASMEGKNIPEKINLIEQTSLPFRNKDFQFYPIPLPLIEKELIDCHKKIKRYVQLINKIILLYEKEEKIRTFFSFSKEVEKLILVSIQNEQKKFFSRFDGYLSNKTKELKILENNSDAPAGTLFTPRINKMSVRFIKEYLDVKNFDIDQCLSPLSFLDESVMIKKIVDCFTDLYSKAPTNLAVFQKNGGANVESVELTKLSNKFNLNIFVVDPRDLTYSDDCVFFKNEKIDLVWNKINTVFWNDLILKDEKLCEKWTNIIAKNNNFMHFNPFCYRYISESKLFSSVLYDPDLQCFFDEDDIEIRNKLIPKSYKLRLDSKVEIDDSSLNLHDYAIKNQNNLVIKECYDIRGDGVTIGLDQDSNYWLEKIYELSIKGGIVQEFIYPNQILFIEDFNKNNLKNLNFHIDTFVFGEEILGHGAKASSNHKVNIFQGGIKVPIIVVKN